jgi:hypothetical protein
MTTVVLSPTGVVGFPEGGGHWWVYLQYVRSLQDLGCDVWWLERLLPGREAADLTVPLSRLEAFGLSGRVLCYQSEDDGKRSRWLVGAEDVADRLVARTELLVNFDYGAPAEVVGRFRRSALVDIDPGLLQSWMSIGQVRPAPHDRWFTTGETVGTDRATFPDGGRPWEHIRPVVHLTSWPVQPPPDAGRYTTVTSWWGDEWMTGSDGSVYENNKRVTFLDHSELPRRIGLPLELAAYFGETASPASEKSDVEPENVGGDAEDVRRMLAGGWRLRRSAEVAGDPWAYRRYVQGSRGEFSCVKPSCLVFQNAWISDRTLCYLASGRPAVVQDTGPSEFLPEGSGLLRFRSTDEAVDALAAVEADYQRHASAARALVEAHFDGVATLARLLDAALAPRADAGGS